MSEYKLRGMKTKEVYDVIKKARKQISLKEIGALTNVNKNTIRGVVQRLLRQGLVKRVGKGRYEAIRKTEAS